jgi:hypothetical protein
MTIVCNRADAIYVTATHVNGEHANVIAGFALKPRLSSFGFAEDGAVPGCRSDYRDVHRRGTSPGGRFPHAEPVAPCVRVTSTNLRSSGDALLRPLHRRKDSRREQSKLRTWRSWPT